MIRKGTKVRYTGHFGKFSKLTGRISNINRARKEYVIEYPETETRARTFVPVPISTKSRSLKPV